MKKTFEITAKLERVIVDCSTVIRFTWITEAKNICEAISKVGEYICKAECFEVARCVWMGVEEIRNDSD